MIVRAGNGAIYRHAVRPAVFALSQHDPERAHELVLRQLAFISRHPRLLRALESASGANALHGSREFFGLRFPGPVGIAAGFDKNGVALAALAAMGFGFIEAGTATWHAQAGQQRPRTWRFVEEASIVNAMGFPNRGAQALARAQEFSRRPRVPVGWNVSKSMVTDIDDVGVDVCSSVRALYPHADYFVVNVSSPNTPGLRRLEEPERLDALLAAVLEQLTSLAMALNAPPKPLLVKISPDLSDGQLDGVVEICLDRGVAGIVATNTTVRRELLGRNKVPDRGGLSGRPLAPRALDVVTHLARSLKGRLPIIGVGGIDSPESAQRMLDAGASLVQLYTGLVFEGPTLVKRLNAALRPRWLEGLDIPAAGTAVRSNAPSP